MTKGRVAGDNFDGQVFQQLLKEEYAKLLEADNRDVHDDSKYTTLPIAKAIVEKYVLSPIKFPWYIDLLNINLNNQSLGVAKTRIDLYIHTFLERGQRITENRFLILILTSLRTAIGLYKRN